MPDTYIPIFLTLAITFIFGIVMANASTWFGPRHPTKEKLSTYESGMEPVRSAHDRFSVKYYIVAMLFIIFDIEVVFLFPWAVTFSKLSATMGAAMLGEMILFIVMLLVGYIYIIKRGVLEWK